MEAGDIQQNNTQNDVNEYSPKDCVLYSDEWNQQKSADQRTKDGSDGIGGVSRSHMMSQRLETPRHQTHHNRKLSAHEKRGNQDQ